MAGQGGFFDMDERLQWLSAVVDVGLFRPELDAAPGRSDRAGG